jgi:Xaa-Pro dipeptidase
LLLNRTRFEEVIARSGLSALVATTPQNIQYAAGYHSERLHNFVALQAYVVMPPAPEDFCLILPSTEMVHLSSKRMSALRLRRYGTFHVMAETDAVFTTEELRLQQLLAEVPMSPSSVLALADALRKSGLAQGRIGIDESNMPWPVLDELRSRLPEARLEPAASWFHFMRMVKTEAELELARRVCAINEEGLRAALGAIRVGEGEDRYYEAFRSQVVALEATPRLWGTSSGRNSSCFFWPGTRTLEPGDLVRIDCGCTRDGYWADTGITAVCGEPRPEHARVYRAIERAIEAGIEAARPGRPVSHVCETVLEVARREGLTDLQRHHCGHGIGLELYEPPMLTRAGGRSDIFAAGFEDTVLEPGMVVNIEAPYYRLGFGGLHLEHTVLVGRDGPEVLTGPRELHVVGGR